MSKEHCNISSDYLSPKEFNDIERRILSDDTSLKDIMDGDKKYLDSVDVTYDQIADKMETIIRKFFLYRDSKKYEWQRKTATCRMGDEYRSKLLKQHGGGGINIKNKFFMSCTTKSVQNQLLDSEHHGNEYDSTNFTITNLRNDLTIKFNTLLIHMIRQHHFFGSPGSSYRLDPSSIIYVLLIKNSKTCLQWYSLGHASFTLPCSKTKVINIMSRYALKVYDDTHYTALLFPACTAIPDDDDDKILKAYELGLEKNLSWKDVRKLVYDKHNNQLPFAQIDKLRIDKECIKIQRYEKSGVIEGLYLYLFPKRMYQMKVFIENIECDIPHCNNCMFYARQQ
ncbi:MAG: hypothetical protein Satyrvirus15_1 [Satyrvirus sp.]|uniref:Uncharacterized protein n=1 Tax=Satyrvirus sp. TaxID=2487771 RepID=A0A3G5AFN8_9VIRU|nr:MAG: hypothetical protein Satyrvirus15_1 [Satyrvirus sp.]